MERTEQIVSLIDFDAARKYCIEPDYRVDEVIGNISDMVTTLTPKSLLKVGAGSGRVLADVLSKGCPVTVLDLSYKKLSDVSSVSGAYLVNGSPSQMPLDYVAFDVALVADYVDIFDSAGVFGELERVLDYGGYLIFAGVVLPDSDIDGAYDELFRSINPLHNDYYLESDLRTILELKGFEYVKGDTFKFRKSVEDARAYYCEFLPGVGLSAGDPSKVIKDYEDVLKKVYSFDGCMIDEYYTVSVYRRKMLE